MKSIDFDLHREFSEFDKTIEGLARLVLEVELRWEVYQAVNPLLRIVSSELISSKFWTSPKNAVGWRLWALGRTQF